MATTIALELTLLVTRSVLRPLADLQKATERVLDGDFNVTVPVTTGDETGELAASFNAMVQGLAERERIRDAFGTYLDREVAEYILSDEFDEEGRELEVSVLFTDVRDFTGFAAGAEAKEVVAALNGLFEVVVPVISRHGGHVDKFEGDGLLAVFGAPGSVSRPRQAGDARRDGDLPARERARRGGRPAGGGGRQHRAASSPAPSAAPGG